MTADEAFEFIASVAPMAANVKIEMGPNRRYIVSFTLHSGQTVWAADDTILEAMAKLPSMLIAVRAENVARNLTQ